jgi:hypothetical protein
LKGRSRPMRGFGSVTGAARSCAAYEEVREHFRFRTTVDEVMALGARAHNSAAA